MKRTFIFSLSLAVMIALSGVAAATELFIRSVINFDPVRNTVTLPCFAGHTMGLRSGISSRNHPIRTTRSREE